MEVLMNDMSKWEIRSAAKDALLTIPYFSEPGNLSGDALNLLAGLPSDAEIPVELFGLT